MSHTPGPWHIWTGSVAVLIQNRADPSLPDNIAKVFTNDPNGDTPMPWQDNARLIAASPNLLDIAEKYIALCTHCGLFQEAEDAKLLVARVRVGE